MKYKPATKKELKKLCKDKSVYLGDIDTSLITDMSGLFAHSSRKDFSGIESWDVSNVRSMAYMFEASSFNHPIDSWNVGNVTDMRNMFDTTPFNQALNSWDVSNVKNMAGMFCGSDFNQPLDSWDVSNVKNMREMFYNSAFNHSLAAWLLGKKQQVIFEKLNSKSS